jgi:phosphatidylserine/phosphatidylglycerophosphate/cardiolipin synthase-like enzyme
MVAGMQKVADACGIALRCKTGNNDINIQAQQVDQVLNERPDLVIVSPVDSEACVPLFRKLNEAGGRVFLYDAGFFHSKTIVVDGTISAVGTMNMDQRSLKLHKEMMCWVFDRGFAQQVADSFVADMAQCHEVTLDDVLAVGKLKRFRNQCARLFSNVL